MGWNAGVTEVMANTVVPGQGRFAKKGCLAAPHVLTDCAWPGRPDRVELQAAKGLMTLRNARRGGQFFPEQIKVYCDRDSSQSIASTSPAGTWMSGWPSALLTSRYELVR